MTASGRHSQDGGTRHSVSELLHTASPVAVLDRPARAQDRTSDIGVPAPRDGSGIIRLPSPRRFPTVELVWPDSRSDSAAAPSRVRPADDLSAAELDALLADPPPIAPAPAGVGEPAPEARGNRFGTVAVAVLGGAMSLVAATLPVDALAGGAGTAALTADTSDAGQGDDRTGGDADGLPPAADAGQIAASITEAHRQVTDQVTASEANLEAARQKAEADRKAAAEKAAADKAAADKAAAITAQRNCGVSEAGLGAVKAHVRIAAQLLGCRFGKPTMLGVGGRGGVSDHPSGRAIDFMVNRSTGDALAACALRNKAALGITYVIWRQRINYGSGWQGMEDRGGVTANHFDHVHVSFGSSGKGTSLQGCG